MLSTSGEYYVMSKVCVPISLYTTVQSVPNLITVNLGYHSEACLLQRHHRYEQMRVRTNPQKRIEPTIAYCAEMHVQCLPKN